MEKICEKPGYITISYNPDKKYVLHDWTSFLLTLDEIRPAFQTTLDFARRHGVYHYIAETSRVTDTLRQDVLDWWGTTWVPTLAKYGLKAIITVVPTSSALARLSTKRWQGQVVDGITMANAASLAEAERMLDQI
jgi:hypothetical protein